MCEARPTDLALQLTEHQDALSHSEEAVTGLHAALEVAGSPADRGLPLEQLVEHARLTVERAQSAIAAHEQLVGDADAAANELGAAQRALQQAKKKLKDWTSRWGEALQPFAISVDTPPAEARATIALINDLADSEKTTADLDHRIASITADYDAFGSAVSALAVALVSDLQESDAIEVIRELDRRAETAKTAATNRAQLEERKRSTLEWIAELEEELSDANGVLSRLCEQARCGTAEELPAVEDQVAIRDRLRDELVELDKRIVEQGEQSVDELRQLLGGRSGDDLAAELARRVRLFELPAKLANSGDGRVSEPYGVDQAGAAKRGAA